MFKRTFALVSILLCLLALAVPPLATPAVAQNALVSLTVEAGYEGYFREGKWTPVRILLSNTGADISGTLRIFATDVVNDPSEAYAASIDLPQGSSKGVFIYLPLSSQAQQVRVELATTDRVIASETRPVRPARVSDILFAVITESPRGSVDLRNFRSGIGDSYQANWRTENVPRLGEALHGLDALILTDADSGNLSTDQREAIRDWVLAGGHLIVTGGPNWQRTAAGVAGLLPVQPNGTLTLTSISPLARFAGMSDALAVPSGGSIVVTQSVLLPGSEVLAEQSGTPLLARRKLGGGVVDYLAVDPGLEPLLSWANRGQFWFTLLTTSGQRPTWTNGIINPDRAIAAADQIKGLRLPDVAQLAVFLMIYIIVIGPLNYLILRRLNRREWAWFSIPLIVILVAGLYYATGFNLRGTQAIVNRLALVQVWPGTERGQVDAVIGVLAPRRSVYDFGVQAGLTLRTLTGQEFGAPSNLIIYEDGNYEAKAFPVDAGTTVPFAASGFVAVQPLEGEARVQLTPGTLGTPSNEAGAVGTRFVGTITNTTGMVLRDVTVLATGGSQQLGTLQIGETRTFRIDVTARQSPPISLGSGNWAALYAGRGTSRSFGGRMVEFTTIRDIMGTEFSFGQIGNRGFDNTPRRQELRRRQTFLESMLQDADSSGGRGTDVYVVGWTDESPIKVTLQGSAFETEDTTAYLYKLPVRVESLAQDGIVELPSAFLTWTPTDQSTRRDATPYDLFLQTGDRAVFRYIPLPLLRLRELTEIRLLIRAGSVASRGRADVYLYDWQAREWQKFDSNNFLTRITDRPARFLGPENAIELRVEPNQSSTTVQLDAIDITLYGRLQNAGQ